VGRGVNLRWLRAGELLAAGGAGLVIASLLEPWYEGPSGKLDAWDTFGPAVVLLLAATCAALALVVSAATERTTAAPVAIGVWCVLLGLAAVIAAVVRVLERPDHTTTTCAGPWLALVGTILILGGAIYSLRDERPSRYEPGTPDPQPEP
jgi:hypothetical protein